MRNIPLVALAAACVETGPLPLPECTFHEVAETVDFTADAAIAAASVDLDDTSRTIDDAFVDPAAAAAWDGLPVHVEHRFTPTGPPTVVSFDPDPDPTDVYVCPAGRALRVPVTYHATAAVGAARVQHVGVAGKLALLATAPELGAISFDGTPENLSTAEYGVTSADAASLAAWTAQTEAGQVCAAAATLWFSTVPSSIYAGSWAADTTSGGLELDCPDGGAGFLRWGP